MNWSALVLALLLTGCVSKGDASFKGHSCLACIGVEIEVEGEMSE